MDQSKKDLMNLKEDDASSEGSENNSDPLQERIIDDPGNLPRVLIRFPLVRSHSEESFRNKRVRKNDDEDEESSAEEDKTDETNSDERLESNPSAEDHTEKESSSKQKKPEVTEKSSESSSSTGDQVEPSRESIPPAEDAEKESPNVSSKQNNRKKPEVTEKRSPHTEVTSELSRESSPPAGNDGEDADDEQEPESSEEEVNRQLPVEPEQPTGGDEDLLVSVDAVDVDLDEVQELDLFEEQEEEQEEEEDDIEEETTTGTESEVDPSRPCGSNENSEQPEVIEQRSSGFNSESAEDQEEPERADDDPDYEAETTPSSETD